MTLPRTREQSAPPRVGGAPVVLLAEDTFDTRELYDLYLTGRGFRVYSVTDGDEAVNTAVELLPDLIVMDLSMPRLDGVTATQRLKLDVRTQHIPVIILTAYPHKATQQGAVDAGADAFLTKPCLPEDLEQQVRRLLASAPERTT